MDGAPEDSFIATFEDPDGNYFQIATPMDPNAIARPRGGYSPSVARRTSGPACPRRRSQAGRGRQLGLTFTDGATVGLVGPRSAWPTSAMTRSSRSRSSTSTPTPQRTCSSTAVDRKVTGAVSC